MSVNDTCQKSILFTPRCSSSLSCINECLATGRGGYRQMSSLCTVIVVWLNSSERSRVSVGMNSPKDWIQRYVRTYLLIMLTITIYT